MKILLNLLEFLAKTFRFLTLAIVSFGCFYYALPVGSFLFHYLFDTVFILTPWYVFVPIVTLIFTLLLIPFVCLGSIWTDFFEVKLIEKYQNFKRKLLNE